MRGLAKINHITHAGAVGWVLGGLPGITRLCDPKVKDKEGGGGELPHHSRMWVKGTRALTEKASCHFSFHHSYNNACFGYPPRLSLCVICVRSLSGSAGLDWEWREGGTRQGSHCTLLREAPVTHSLTDGRGWHTGGTEPNISTNVSLSSQWENKDTTAPVVTSVVWLKVRSRLRLPTVCVCVILRDTVNAR